MAGNELTEKQARFVEEYLVDLNATQAAIRAGYSQRTAMEQGYQLLQKTSVQQAITGRQLKLQEATGVTQKRVIEEYAKIAFSDIRAFYNEDGTLKNITDLDDEAAASLAGIEIDELFEGYGDEREQTGISKKIKRWDKVKALDSLARHLGLFKEDNDQSRPLVQITGMKVI